MTKSTLQPAAHEVTRTTVRGFQSTVRLKPSWRSYAPDRGELPGASNRSGSVFQVF
jgi:hypothetical protein